MSDDEGFMKKALELAEFSSRLGEVPVGALVVIDGRIVAQGFNRRELLHSPLEHAELMAINEASRSLGRWRLSDATMYCTLEPCVMCAGAMLHARIKTLVFGAHDPKFGAIESLYALAADARLNHRFNSKGGILGQESAQLLRQFFHKRRQAQKNSI